jgi:hypothetical protein
MFETKYIYGTLIMPMTMLIGIGLGETCMGPLVVITMTILNIIHLAIIKKTRKYLINSLLSQILRDNYENIP